VIITIGILATSTMVAYEAVALMPMYRRSKEYLLQTKAAIALIESRRRILPMAMERDEEFGSALAEDTVRFATGHQAKVDQWMALLNDIKKRQRRAFLWALALAAFITLEALL
jgi:hypothetical protein